MGAITDNLKLVIARNIRDFRERRFPGRGGAQACAEAFAVSPRQWLTWERGARTPDAIRLARIAKFFGVTVARLRRNNRRAPGVPAPASPGDDAQPAPSPEVASAVFPPGTAAPFVCPFQACRFLKCVLRERLTVNLDAHGIATLCGRSCRR